MNRRTVSASLALASAAAFTFALLNCGGPQINLDQIAQQPGMHRATPFSITIDGQKVSYRSATTEASYDASTRVLSLYVSGDSMDDDDSLMHSTCDFKSFETGPAGNYAIVRFKDFDPTKMGTYTETDADIVSFVGGYPTTKKGALSGVTTNVTESDNNRIVGALSGGSVSGQVDAWPCFVDGGPGGMAAPVSASDSASAAPATSAAPSADATDAGAPAADASTPRARNGPHDKAAMSRPASGSCG